MKLWELIIQEDNRLDLADPVIARKGLVSRLGDIPFDAKTENLWNRRVLTLRSVVRRLFPGVKVERSHAPFHDLTADGEMNEEVSHLRPAIRRRIGTPPDEPLSRENFDGLRLTLPFPEPNEFAAAAEVRMFWQQVFASMVSLDAVAPVCGKCGTDLPPSPNGKPSQAKLCRKCYKRENYVNKDPQGRKDAERIKKAKQRAAKKLQPSKGMT